MEIKLLGVRGSLPTPLTNDEYQKRIKEILTLALRENVRLENIETFFANLPQRLSTVFGGNTTCVLVTSKAGTRYILDCGTGIRPLGDELIKGECGQGKGVLHIFITHTHWDHIQGLPFFKPLYIKGNILNFYSPYEDLENRLITQQGDFRFFPAPFDKTLSTKTFHLLKPENPIVFDDGITIDCYPLKHPGGSYAYRFKEDGKTFIFATDVEFTGEVFEKLGTETDFFLHADLVVIDSQYTLDESFFKFDWGHTAYTAAVNCGIRWHVKKLVLTHHEPSYSDEKLAGIFLEALEHRDAMKVNNLELFMGVEGLTFIV